jgi:hypothetical protein
LGGRTFHFGGWRIQSGFAWIVGEESSIWAIFPENCVERPEGQGVVGREERRGRDAPDVVHFKPVLNLIKLLGSV